MDYQDKQFMDRLMATVEENNRILHRLQRNARFARLWHVFYWLIVIGISVGAFYFLQPYIDQLISTYKGIQSEIENVRNLTGFIRN